jgi:hypothetical protein
MKPANTDAAYQGLAKALYGAKRRVEEIEVPPFKVISVSGNEPPASEQYQHAIGALYGIAYGLKMGLKFGKIPKPPGYFDYKVGALETLWWSTGKVLDITNARTLRWQAYLMVPPFVSKKLLELARQAAKARNREIPYEAVTLETLKEGRAVQMLHVGPYAGEKPTIDALLEYVAEHGLVVAGKHHEIYLSDPSRTKPDKLKTVIRYPVKPAGFPLREPRTQPHRSAAERALT